MSTISEFSPDMGLYASVAQSAQLIENSKTERLENGQAPGSYTRSQFFGKEKLVALLGNTGNTCVGLKISILLEGDGLMEGLLVQAVDKDGNILTVSPVVEALGASGDGDNGVYGGPKCPPNCVPPPNSGD